MTRKPESRDATSQPSSRRTFLTGTVAGGLIAAGGNYHNQTTEEEEMKISWRKLPLATVRQGHMGFVEPDLISRATPSILLGAQKICEQVAALRK